MGNKLPEFKDDDMYRLLRDEKIKEFNQLKAGGKSCDLIGADFRNISLRGIDAEGLDFSNCYFRQCDLRGIDFSKSKLEGASINSAQISGAYFPLELSAEEIMMSVNLGTRMRYRKD